MPVQGSDALEVLALEPDIFAVALWRRVVIVLWMRQGTLATVAAVRGALEVAYGRLSGQTLSVIHVIRDQAGLPEQPVRDAVLQMSTHFAPRTACLAIVLLGAGFWASAMQSLLTALRFIARQRSAMMRFSRDLDELCKWFPLEHNTRAADTVQAEQLAQVVERMLRATRSPALAAPS